MSAQRIFQQAFNRRGRVVANPEVIAIRKWRRLPWQLAGRSGWVSCPGAVSPQSHLSVTASFPKKALQFCQTELQTEFSDFALGGKNRRVWLMGVTEWS